MIIITHHLSTVKDFEAIFKSEQAELNNKV
jgi:hypothetical protein